MKLTLGTTTTTVEHPDPRFGLVAPMTTTQRRPPGNTQRVVERTRSLSSPGSGLFDFSSYTETAKINGRTFTEVYDPTARTWTMTSPKGRISKRTTDTAGRLVETGVGQAALTPATFTYDQGRIPDINQRARVTSYGYHTTEGWLESVTDAENQEADCVKLCSNEGNCCTKEVYFEKLGCGQY